MDDANLKNEVAAFDRDAAGGDGYIYTTTDKLSSRLATANLERLILRSVSMQGKRVADIGCGDGHFTRRFYDLDRPASMRGLDPAPNAVAVAASKALERNMEFTEGSGHALPWADNSFDIAMIQGVLHHDDKPWTTIQEALRVAPEVVILEPNGNNLGLKIIEKVSQYHREHSERSYSTRRLFRWIRSAGGEVAGARFGGFVPMFAPDPIARAMKMVEPVVERTPVIGALCCSVIVVVARRRNDFPDPGYNAAGSRRKVAG
ncbi:MAG: class I SAM-dependent methyltransferase [Actinomycetota bacterium]